MTIFSSPHEDNSADTRQTENNTKKTQKTKPRASKRERLEFDIHVPFRCCKRRTSERSRLAIVDTPLRVLHSNDVAGWVDGMECNRMGSKRLRLTS